jgi:translation elongation factor EF-1alpha
LEKSENEARAKSWYFPVTIDTDVLAREQGKTVQTWFETEKKHFISHGKLGFRHYGADYLTRTTLIDIAILVIYLFFSAILL